MLSSKEINTERLFNTAWDLLHLVAFLILLFYSYSVYSLYKPIDLKLNVEHEYYEQQKREEEQREIAERAAAEERFRKEKEEQR